MKFTNKLKLGTLQVIKLRKLGNNAHDCSLKGNIISEKTITGPQLILVTHTLIKCLNLYRIL